MKHGTGTSAAPAGRGHHRSGKKRRPDVPGPGRVCGNGLGRLYPFYRSGFASHGLHYDVALTLLETAAIHLERGELATVQVLAGELAPIFEAKGVHVHAKAALQLFVEAVTRQTATAVLARCLLDYLFRARHDETLQFSLSVVDPPRRGSV
jgi:hypothetical protein